MPCEVCNRQFNSVFNREISLWLCHECGCVKLQYVTGEKLNPKIAEDIICPKITKLVLELLSRMSGNKEFVGVASELGIYDCLRRSPPCSLAEDAAEI